MSEYVFLPVMYYRACYIGYTLRKDSPIISNIQRNGQNSSFWTQNFNICYNIFHFIAFVNTKWLTPDEREPPACSSPAIESIGGILRERGIAICCICYHLTLPICLFFVIYYQFLAISCDIPLWWKGRTWTLAWCGGCHSWGRAPAWYIPWLAIRCLEPRRCGRSHRIWMFSFLVT